jgi:hypothetical protein
MSTSAMSSRWRADLARCFLAGDSYGHPEGRVPGICARVHEDIFAPEQLNELGEQGWEAVGLSLKYGDFIAWPVVLLKRPLV